MMKPLKLTVSFSHIIAIRRFFFFLGTSDALLHELYVAELEILASRPRTLLAKIFEITSYDMLHKAIELKHGVIPVF